jgi:hypothetical protein
MAGDNNLSEDGVKDIREMEETGEGQETFCIVEFDSQGPQPGGFNGTIRYEITQKDPRTGKGHRKVIERFEDRDSGDKETLVKSLKWATEDYSSENYLVVIWNHGSGFRDTRRLPLRAGLRGAPRRRAGTLFNHSISLSEHAGSRNIATDDTTGNNLDMIELSDALQEAGFSDSSKKMGVLGFDACLMNMLEVTYEMSKNAHLLVGSEELEPGLGWPYAHDLKSLNSIGADSVQLAKDLVKNYRQFYSRSPYNTDEYWPVTQSAVDLDQISELAASVNEFGATINSSLTSDYDNVLVRISAIREEVQHYTVNNPQADFDDYVDLGDLALLFRDSFNDSNVKTSASKVIENLKKAVIAETHLGKEVQNSHGLTIWFPETAHKYHLHRKSYEKLAMTKKFNNWNNFLNNYHRTRAPSHALRRGKF